MKKRSGIPENIDLNDFASVVVVDQDNTNMEQEFDQNEAGEFMQVVNRKGRPPPPPLANRDDRRSFERTGPKMGDKSGYDKYRDQRDNFNKQNKTSYERRQNKLPPRLAKVREVSRAQARSGGVSPSGMEQNGWPEGDKMGVFQVEDLGTNAWEKPPPRREKDGPEDMRASPKASKENGGIQQTMVFENTALKGGKVDKSQMDKSGIQLPVGLGKPEDNMDVVKLDFGFGGDDLSGQGKPPMSIPRSMSHLSSAQGLPASPSTDDLSAKLANTKKLWDSPGMPAVPENPATVASWNDGSTFNENSGFEGFQDPGSQNVENNGGYDKNDGGKNSGHIPNMKHPHHHQLHMDQDNRQNNPMQFSRNMPGAIPSPPTQMNQMGAMQPQPWGFPMDRTSTIYNPYGASQLLMQGTHSIGTDLFLAPTEPAATGCREVDTTRAPYRAPPTTSSSPRPTSSTAGSNTATRLDRSGQRRVMGPTRLHTSSPASGRCPTRSSNTNPAASITLTPTRRGCRGATLLQLKLHFIRRSLVDNPN